MRLCVCTHSTGVTQQDTGREATQGGGGSVLTHPLHLAVSEWTTCSQMCAHMSRALQALIPPLPSPQRDHQPGQVKGMSLSSPDLIFSCPCLELWRLPLDLHQLPQQVCGPGMQACSGAPLFVT